MKYWGIYGLAIGGIIGLLCAILLAVIVRPLPPADRIAPPTISPDATVFVSERSLSRIASETLQRPATIDFAPNGRMTVSTRLELGRLAPVVNFGLRIELQGPIVASELEWIRIGFLTIPARLLPQTVVEASQNIGALIKQQTPSDFALVGLTTSADGITFQLKWVGQ